MNSARRQLEAARARRDAARDEFDARLHHLRGDPQAQTIGERLIDRIAQDARRSMDRALDVASESKGIAAATAAMLTVWFLRAPIIAWIGEMWDGDAGTTDEIDENDQPEEVSPNA